MWLYHRVMSPNDAGAVWSGSALFAQAYLSENLGSLRYIQFCYYRKFPKYSDTQRICCNHPKSWTRWCFLRVIHPKDAEGIANSVDPDQSLIWVCTVCPDLSVRKLRKITVVLEIMYANVHVDLKHVPHSWGYMYRNCLSFEPSHEKTCLSHVWTIKAQISLCILSVWSAPLLFAA